MALIHCPECKREISDTVKSCPHCGYTVKEELPQRVEVTSVSLKSKNPAKSKKILIGLVVIALVFAVGYIGITQSASEKKETDARSIRNDYIDTLNMLKDTSLVTASESEFILNLTASVWRDTIFEEYNRETYKFTVNPKYLIGPEKKLTSGYSFRKDFNDSLSALYEDPVVSKKTKLIRESRPLVDNLMKKLNNPPEEFDMAYNTAQSLYSSFQSVTDMALSPSGNLESYSNAKNDVIAKYMDSYKLLSTQIPEKEE